MPFFGDDTITNFFQPIRSKDKRKDPSRLRKRKQPEEDTEANRSLTVSGSKKPKVQQKLVFSDGGQDNGGSSKKEYFRVAVKGSNLKRGEPSTSLVRSSFETSSPGEALSRVSSSGTPSNRHLHSLPTPMTSKRLAPAQPTRSFLTPPNKVQPMDSYDLSPSLSPGPPSNFTSRNSNHLPTPVTMPRHSNYYTRAQESPASSAHSLSPPRDYPSLEGSQSSTFFQHEESAFIEDGQRLGDYCRDESPLLIPSQNLVPSSQSQADGMCDLTPEGQPEPSTTRRHSLFLVPSLPDRVTASTKSLEIDDDEGRYVQSSQSQDISTPPAPHSPTTPAAETSLVEIKDGHEYVLSSQSQLLMPLQVSPRKVRRRLSYSSSSSQPDDGSHSDEIVPSSQSQSEKELIISSQPLLDPPTRSESGPATVQMAPSMTHRSTNATRWSSLDQLNWHTSTSFSDSQRAPTQVLVEETPTGYYDLPPSTHEDPGSATEEESGDEEDFPHAQLESPVHEPPHASQEVPLPLQELSEYDSYPSSLPDVVKEFREMFGDGDGRIGLESSILFAQEGAHVLLVDNRIEAAEAGAALISKRFPNVKALAIKADVSKEQDVKNAVDTAVKEFGRLDVMFNNAGIMHPEDDNALNTEERIWDLTMQINLKGVWWGCKYAILAMRQNPTDESKGLHTGGSIINTASFVALVGAATPQLAYTASKGAVLAMTRELAIVHAREGIRINSLCPGPLKTPLLMDFLNTEEKRERRLVHLPMGRFGEAVELAKAALFLASDDSSYMTGTDLKVDGGLSSAYVTPIGEPVLAPPQSLTK
ncbi:hypothetical protein DXG01_007218 [Tephrocybe rancida]|nr:hypothetical protein DXG01_007218 [Tephrocybe rancida]